MTRQMTKSNAGQSSSNSVKESSRPAGSNTFPGGNWPSKVPGRPSGGNRGQGPKR
jgi:hypothetical protein